MPTPQFNIKVGSDSVLYLLRENTTSDGFDALSEDIGKIKDRDSSNGTDNFEYPTLVRRTGDSLKGTTESIESNELRKGRTKSAPRKGSSSSEGSLDFEFSPETYDDVMEATLRGKWTEWSSDKNSAINLDNDSCEDGYFLTKAGDLLDKNYQSTDIGDRSIKTTRKLFGTKKEYSEAVKSVIAAAAKEGVTLTEKQAAKDPSVPLIVTSANELEVHELTCGEDDIRYAILKQFGGVKGDDLFQEFEHMAVDTISLEVTPGEIVTGSFSFMGSNNPDLVQKGVRKFESVTEYEEGETYYTYNSEKAVYTKDAVIVDAATFATELARVQALTIESEKCIYREITSSGLIGKLATIESNEGRFYSSKTPEEVQEWIENLPEKGTSTDQYTARQGFLYVNGERVQYGSTLSLELSNGLNKTYAIFEKDAIATSPLTLDITGTLGIYLIKDYAELIANLCTQDKDVELLFCFQDKENDDEDSENMYVVQIFKSKFTDTDLSSGAENLEISLPFQSFEEQAMRVFRLRKRKPVIYDFDPLRERKGTDDDGNVYESTIGYCKMSSVLSGDTEATLKDKLSATLKLDGKDIPVTIDVDQKMDGTFRVDFVKNDDGTVPTIEKIEGVEQLATLTIKYNDEVVATKSVKIGAAESSESTTVTYTYSKATSYTDGLRYYQLNNDGTYSEVTDIAEDRSEADNFTVDGTADGAAFYTRVKSGETDPEKLFVATPVEVAVSKLGSLTAAADTVASDTESVATAALNTDKDKVVITPVAVGDAVITVTDTDSNTDTINVTVNKYGTVSYTL